jgi:flagellar hook-associated protein 1 FlgK
MSILSNALTGANAAQAALNTVSQNLSNLQTPGYTRQGVVLGTIGPMPGTRGPGNGVAVTSLLRFSDSYKTQQMWRANSTLGQYTQNQPYLSQLEKVMSGSKSSISYGIDTFFAALHASAGDPTSTPLRQQVITAADSMSQYFNSIYNLTVTQQRSVAQQTDALLPQINVALQGIASLNDQIGQAGALGSNNSALIDARDTAIDKLAGMVAIEVQEQPDGSRSVSLKGGQPLVIGKLASSLSSTTVAGVPTLQLNLTGSVYTLNGATVGGQLGGLSSFAQNTLQPLQQSIVDLAQQLAAKVNTQLGAGSDIAGNPGGPLLAFTPGGVNGLLQLAPGVTAAGLAFAGPPPNNTPGDSSNLQLLLQIQGQPVNLASIGSVLIGDADTQLVGKLGTDSQQNQSLMATADTIRQQAEDDWKSTSSVNKDEEAINLVEFQSMYQANMKVITMANTLFDSILATFQ